MGARAIVAAEQAAYQYGGCGTSIGPFDFEAGPGEFHLLAGPSGCGKSTLARLLSGVIPHLYRGQLHGRVTIDGRPTEAVPLWELSARVGLVSQNPAAQLLTSTVGDEIAFGLENSGMAADEIEARSAYALDCFGLVDVIDRDPRTLSGGEQQKLLLSALTARAPEVLILDEPLSMLDASAAVQVVDHLRHLARTGTAIVAFDHRSDCYSGVDGLSTKALAGMPASTSTLPELPQNVPPFRFKVEGLGVRLGACRVLEDVNIELAGGQVVTIVGANGSGKTTLLRALAGLQAYKGRVLTSTSKPPRLGLCFQNPDRQIFNATVREEILFGLAHHDEDFYHLVLDLLGLTPYEYTPPLLLSEGEKKRLGLAIVLLRPGLGGVCLDEPTLGQDMQQRRVLGRIIRRLAAAGYLCVTATHDLEWARQWSDRIVRLDRGEICDCAPAPAPSTATARTMLLPPSLVNPCTDGH